jgi:lysophospholipase L1-like esterase
VRRRLLIALAVLVLVPVIVLGVEVQLARTAERLEDEDGFRPGRLVVRPGPDALDVVWLGDSTATGVGTGTVEQSMAFRVAEGLTPRPTTLTILAVSGAEVAEVGEEQLPDLAATEADVVFVSVGANDVTALTRTGAFRTAYRELLEGITAALPAAEVVLVGIPDMGTAPRLAVPLRQIAGARGAQLDQVIADLAQDHLAQHIDLAERTSRTFSSDPDRYFSDDGYHPGPDGHGVWADAVLAAVDAGRFEP